MRLYRASVLIFLSLFVLNSNQAPLNDYFSLDYEIINSELEFTLTAKTQGWISFGFGSSMFSSELFVCFYDSTNTLVASHYNSNDEVTPQVINSEPIFLLYGFRNTTHTSCTIKRALQVNSPNSINITLSKPMDIIYAFGINDNFEYHNERRNQTNFMFYHCGSYCDTWDFVKRICLKCASPSIIIDGFCQIFTVLSPNYSDDFKSFIQKGVIQAIFSNGTTKTSSCSLDICSECNSDNTTCLKCKYNNYILSKGICQENYANEKYTTFSLTSNLSLYYMIDNDEISISLIAKAQGWIALGLGSSMTEADIFMCNKTIQDTWQALEMKSTGEKTPLLDQTQDLTFVLASRNSSHTLCNFRRKLISSDSNDKEIVINAFNDVIYAIGRNDYFSYHIEKGMKSINFSNSTNPSKCPSNCTKCDSDDQCITCVNYDSVVINGICQINDISILPSSGVVLENIFTLYWNFSTDETTVQIMIKTSNMGYVSLGLGKCMKNCDIHVAEYDEYSNIILKDMFSKSESYPSKDIDLGGTEDLKLLGYGKKNGYMFIKYERKIKTGDKWDFLLEQGDHEMSYAFSSGPNLQYHNGNRGSFTIHFVQGYNGGVDMEDTKSSLTRLHGILLFVAWGGLIDVALFFGRYLKTVKWYVESHGFILFTTCLLSTIMESLLIYKSICFFN